jgi:hypothetical protein
MVEALLKAMTLPIQRGLARQQYKLILDNDSGVSGESSGVDYDEFIPRTETDNKLVHLMRIPNKETLEVELMTDEILRLKTKSDPRINFE